MARKRGKKYTEVAKLVDRSRAYPPEEAIQVVKQTSPTKFDATVEAHVRLGIDPRQNDQQLRSTVVLPHGTGRSVRVIVFAQGENAREAQEAGADRIGGEDLAADIQGGWLEFDVAVATPDMMRFVTPLGRVLGPRGLMPNARTGTVTQDIARTIREIKAGRVEFRTERNVGQIHVPIGKVSFDEASLMENLRALMTAVVTARPAGAKGQYLRGVTLASTMGPGVDLDLPAATALGS